MTKLTAVQVRRAGPGIYSDGRGLILRVKESGARSWILRVQVAGRRRDIGLGSDADLSLLEAREKAAHLRKIARQGLDPIAERDKEKVVVPTFAEATARAHAELGPGWGDKTAEQFLASLTQHAIPVIGKRRVDAIGPEHVIQVLSPIWTTKPEIARKVRQRVRKVLSFAKAKGWRSERVPAPEEISDGLAKQPGSSGFAAMEYQAVPAFMAELRGKQETPARLALLFTILTAARSGEVRNATWSQIDRKTKLWRRDKAFMKAGKEHNVTLSPAALAVLDRAEALYGKEGLVFPSMRGKVLSDAALGKMMRDAGRSETVHGFRKSFRNWAAEERPEIPFLVPELCLAHSPLSKVQEAYLTSDVASQRRLLMNEWGEFLT